MKETQVQSLGQEDPLEEEMATHSRIRAWRIPWTGSVVGYGVSKESGTTKQAEHTHRIKEFAGVAHG